MFNFKRILAFTLTLLMFASVLSFGVFAEGSIEDGDVNVPFDDVIGESDTYNLTEDKEGYVFAYMDPHNAETVDIKSEYEGKPVVAIGEEALENATNLTEAVIPGTVRSIAYKAFAGCTALNKVVIPESVETIDTTAFEGCEGLTVYGTKGSAAETFAKDKGFDFFAIVWGDANEDQKVTALDIIRYKKYLSSDGITMGIGADTNGDNAYDSTDVAKLKRYFAELVNGVSSVILGPRVN